jgi:hypothetical protein
MKSHRRTHIDKKLLIRLRMFAFIFLVMAGVGVYNVLVGNVRLVLALSALGGGILVGLIVGRANRIIWHEEDGKAIAKMDAFGIMILVAYIVFAIFRKQIFGHWLAGHELSGFIIWFSSGIMLGRLLTLRKMVIKVLRGQGL